MAQRSADSRVAFAHNPARLHLSIDDVVDAHQRVLLVATVSLQAILGRS